MTRLEFEAWRKLPATALVMEYIAQLQRNCQRDWERGNLSEGNWREAVAYRKVHKLKWTDLNQHYKWEKPK